MNHNNSPSRFDTVGSKPVRRRPIIRTLAAALGLSVLPAAVTAACGGEGDKHPEFTGDLKDVLKRQIAQIAPEVGGEFTTEINGLRKQLLQVMALRANNVLKAMTDGYVEREVEGVKHRKEVEPRVVVHGDGTATVSHTTAGMADHQTGASTNFAVFGMTDGRINLGDLRSVGDYIGSGKIDAASAHDLANFVRTWTYDSTPGAQSVVYAESDQLYTQIERHDGAATFPALRDQEQAWIPRNPAETEQMTRQLQAHMVGAV